MLKILLWPALFAMVLCVTIRPGTLIMLEDIPFPLIVVAFSAVAMWYLSGEGR